MTELHIIVLAAGQGKRMGGDGPKVLAPLAHQSLLAHVLGAANQLDPATLQIVVGYQAKKVVSAFGNGPYTFVEQAEQRGTGHATRCALDDLAMGGTVLVLFGDTPLVRPATMRKVVDAAQHGPAILTAVVEDPAGYGRILRDGDDLLGIVEHKDASAAQRSIHEINSGMLAAPAVLLAELLQNLGTDNAQGEYYLTDIIAAARAAGKPCSAVIADDADEILGANDRWQLAQLERVYQRYQARALCEAGAQIMDPNRIDVRGSVTTGKRTVIDVGVVFEGRVELADDVSIGPYCVIKDSRLGPGTRIQAHSVLEGVETDGDCDIGPFARLRPGTHMAEKTRIGNFVETKKTQLGRGSKANHLTYLGDTTVGEAVNVGAGTITCNYDGVNKHQTQIGSGAFIGSGTQLVAPAKVGENATIGAGSVITRPAPADKLTVSRPRQMTIEGWQRPKKKQD